ncbi:MAG: patatin-like phospholipase family protein [Pseudomonadota bacterium]
MKIGLALSGGGSRAMAFHLGCMRALHQRGVLDKIAILSSVSGGSVIAALYSYWDDPFDEFEARVRSQLRRGYVGGIARQTLFSSETPKILMTQLTAGLAAFAGATVGLLLKASTILGVSNVLAEQFAMKVHAPLLRRASRSTAFERHLKNSVFGDRTVDEVKRKNLNVIINATELRTGTAFRFGSTASGCWRYGSLVGKSPHVSKAVAASAAYPALLPSFHEDMTFDKGGVLKEAQVVLTDGGVYDNLGITPILPGRSPEFTSHASGVDFIICCDASSGLPSGTSKPYGWISRMLGVVNTIHRRTHVLSYSLLHHLSESEAISGFLLPYLGQQDSKLPVRPPNLVPREEVADYPTDFNPMKTSMIELLSLRGEQLTHALIDAYHPDLGS